jgi:hypothetical protein
MLKAEAAGWILEPVFFSNRVTKSWNEIPEEIKNVQTSKRFKLVYSRWKQYRARPEEP